MHWIGQSEQVCGSEPNVTLSCNYTNGTAYVDWAASKPDCQFDCKAHWICACRNNITYIDEVGTCSKHCIHS